MKVLITGSTGMIGQAVCRRLHERGDTPIRLLRPGSRRSHDSAQSGERSGGDEASGAERIETASWDPQTGRIDEDALQRADALIHLAGENIASGRWTASKKARIRDSRVGPTEKLAQALREAPSSPSTWIAASAIGIYGQSLEPTPLEESAGVGEGFLADVAAGWERATEPAAEAGLRVVHARLGIVLSRRGGAMPAMLPIFKLGLGGPVGSGRQYWSWIALDDVVEAMLFLLDRDAVRGPVNFTAPNPVTNREFTRTLGRVLSRPTALSVPAWAARLALGEMADPMLIKGARVFPQRLENEGFQFRFPDLEPALRHVLRKSAD